MKKHREKSFISHYIKLNIVNFIIFILVSVIIIVLIILNIINKLPNLTGFVYRYEDNLINDEYEKIKLNSNYDNSAFLVYDENDKLLYSYHEELINDVNIDDKYYINEVKNDYEYQVFENEELDGYYIVKSKINTDTLRNNVIEYAHLNKELEVIDGNMFSDADVLTPFRLDLITGVHDGYRYELYTYKNKDNLKRTIIFKTPDATLEYIFGVINSSGKLWLLLVLSLVIVIVLEVLFYKWRLEKSIKPLNNLMSLYDKKKEINIQDYKIAKEFKPVVSSYIKLLEENRKNEEDKNLIIASISHDLKTPLTAIKGYTKAFQDDLVSLDKKDEYINSMMNKIDVTNDLINKLFDFTTLTYSGYRLNLEVIDINRFTRNYLKKKSLDFETNDFVLEEEIPKDKLMCEIDKSLFTRVYDNILQNSFRYNKKHTKVLFKIVKYKDKIRIIIADNGKGIPDNIKDTIFELFVTENKARTLGEGTGLGLPMVRQIIKLHKGSIKLSKKTTSNYVTEFIIELPKSDKS